MGYLTQEMISASSVFAIESKFRDIRTAEAAASNSIRLPDIVAKYSRRKPMMIFCFTRKSTIETARLLATLWITGDPRDRHWPGPRLGHTIAVKDSELRSNSSDFGTFTYVDLIQMP